MCWDWRHVPRKKHQQRMCSQNRRDRLCKMKTFNGMCCKHDARDKTHSRRFGQLCVHRRLVMQLAIGSKILRMHRIFSQRNREKKRILGVLTFQLLRDLITETESISSQNRSYTNRTSCTYISTKWQRIRLLIPNNTVALHKYNVKQNTFLQK